MQERKEKRLCYLCDEKYQARHRCNMPRLYLLEGMEFEEDEGLEEEGITGQREEIPAAPRAELLSIFLHAIASAPQE